MIIPKLFLATSNGEIYLKDSIGIHLLPIEGTRITFYDDSLWSIKDDSLWKLRIPVEQLVEGPYSHFVDKGLVNIHPTDGGILVITSSQKIYYVNPWGEFYLLKDLETEIKICREEKVKLFDARPPYLLFKHDGYTIHSSLVNADYPEDYIKFYKEVVGFTKWNDDIAIVFENGTMMFISKYITSCRIISGKIKAFCELPVAKKDNCCMRDYCFTTCETDENLKLLQVYKGGEEIFSEQIDLDIVDITYDQRDDWSNLKAPPVGMQ